MYSNDNNSKQNQTSGNNGTPSGGRLLDRYTVSPQTDEQDKSPYYKSSAPSISLPKGGGALKGIDEKFTVNAVNGTAAIDVPLPLTPGRSGFTPKLSLGYNSGSGNGVFGLGWGLSLPAIQRRTDKQLPMYDDGEDSDVFVLAGAEDLQPALKEDGDRDEYISSDTNYLIRRYLPRIEGLFARIELITASGSTGSWWRVTTKDNITTYYGLTEEGRISDPADNSRIFKWLPQISYDHKGNVQQYCYVNEDSSNVGGIAERNRLNGLAPFTNTYLKSVKYCNQGPYFVDTDSVYEPALPLAESASPAFDPAYLMELVFDYGEHDADAPTPEPATDTTWPCRIDPFSDFHAGFEIRTYRRCMRVLMFHYFSELTGDSDGPLNPVLVYSLDMAYQNLDAAMAPGTYAEADLINSITHTGYQSYTDGDALAYNKKSLPAMTMDYQPLQWDHTIHNVSKKDAENAPQGLTGPYQWIDLWGEGLPGILTEQAGGWFYKQNLGDGHFAPSTSIAPKPSVAGLGSSLQWQDLDADGRRQLVSHTPGLPGYFELDDEQDWLPFRAFKERVNVDWDSPYTKILDLNGDGRPDILLTEERAWRWYENKGAEGYTLGGYGPVSYDEEKAPRMLLNDMMQVIFLADMNGDGMTDIVRIQNSEVCYWPNMGFGKFGAKVTMSNAPRFDRPDMFNPMYITLADISGTGAADLIYLGGNQCTAWVNLAGNAWSAATVISPLPGTDTFSKIAVMDFLGNGTPCIVWSSPLPQYASAPMRYIDLMGGNKPYLMNSYSNNMGKTTTLTYKQSTDYYLEDMAAGTPWATRLPFPVHCVSAVTTADSVSETTYTQSYTYHHGYYDHPEREFRGFGRVDVTDTDIAVAYDPGSIPAEDDLNQAPVLTKTWYHTGAWMQEGTLLSAFATEYYSTDWATLPDEPDLSANSDMTAQEVREAYRALKGQSIRQEIYALDGTDLQGVPYMVSANSFAVNRLQPVGDNLYACFYSYTQQSLQWHCERNTDDPRVTHSLTTSIDAYGNVLEAAQVSYPRSSDNATGIANIDNVQQAMLVSYTVNAYTDDASDTGTDNVDNYFLRLPYQNSVYQLHNLDIPDTIWSVTDMQTAYSDASNLDYTGDPTGGDAARRLLSRTRTTYLNNKAVVILDLGTVDSLGLVYRHYQLAVTETILENSAYYDSKVTEGILVEGAYILEGNITEFPITDMNNYWLPSGTIQYSNSLSPVIDVTETFYLPFGFTDPWGNTTCITYWAPYYLLPKTTKDAVDNRTVVCAYDWRCLQPTLIKDPNDNISTILFDELCMPVAAALEGKGSEGDDISGVDPTDSMDISYQSDFWTDPEGNAANLLKGATWRCIYDLTASPVCVAMIAREQHDAVSYTSPMQIRLTYTDGLGRIAMHKLQATDNPISPTEERWIGSGKTVYNNKGKVVMQYEPYYSYTAAYDTAEQAAAAGVTPRMHYDPLGRVIRTDLADGSYTMTEFDAWQQIVYDNNDTVELTIDGSVVDSDWYTAWSSGTTEQQDAATKALAHANTPTIMQFDTLARPFYTRQYLSVPDPSNVAGTDYYDTYVTLDIEGNRLAVVDARNSETLVYTSLQYTYNMLKAVAAQVSADSGSQLLLSDVAGQPLYAWDADMRQFHYEYDELRRPVEKDVTPSGGSNKVLELMVYGEGQTDDKTYNLRGKLYMQYDGAGTQTIPSYDFKGNPLSSIRQYVSDYTKHPDWTDIGSVDMETDTYETDMAYDALNRPVTITTPDDGTTNYTYDKGGLLCSVDIDSVGTGADLSTDIINYIAYDAKGQRTKVQYENGASTFYHYDPYTFRVTKIKTIRSSDSKVLQDLKYWYDPIGNITIQDDDAQEDAYFSNTVVCPDNNYTYDPLYRLIQVNGRENATGNTAPDYADSNSVNQPLPNDASLIRNYSQYYTYDPAGNMLEMQHVAGSNGWTRDFTISDSCNQTTGNSIGSSKPVGEKYAYDARGNMIYGLNNLSSSTSPVDDNMIYNEENRLEQVAITATITAYYQYDGSGQRVRKVKNDTSTGGLMHVRKYIGQWELYDKIDNGTSSVLLERETLHVMDDKARIALIDTPTTVPSGSTEGQVQRYQFSNHLPSASLELDDSACVISYEEYYPFGSTSFQAITSAIEVSLKRYRYTGKERDEETGFYYHGARYYVPWLARWIASEPLYSEWYNVTHGHTGLSQKRDFEELTPSAYEYCYSNPVKFSDPTGEQTTNGQNANDQALLQGLMDKARPVYNTIPSRDRQEEQGKQIANVHANQKPVAYGGSLNSSSSGDSSESSSGNSNSSSNHPAKAGIDPTQMAGITLVGHNATGEPPLGMNPRGWYLGFVNFDSLSLIQEFVMTGYPGMPEVPNPVEIQAQAQALFLDRQNAKQDNHFNSNFKHDTVNIKLDQTMPSSTGKSRSITDSVIDVMTFGLHVASGYHDHRRVPYTEVLKKIYKMPDPKSFPNYYVPGLHYNDSTKSPLTRIYDSLSIMYPASDGSDTGRLPYQNTFIK